MSKKEEPTVAIAKRAVSKNKRSKIVELSTGYLAEISPVSLSILNDVQLAIEMPKVPTFMNEEKGRVEENPNHPDYLKAVEECEQRRNLAAADAMIMFGVQLVDREGNHYAYDDDVRWLKKLQHFQRMGILKLDDYDLEDDFDLEFLFKKYIAVGAGDIMTIGKMSGVDEEAVQEAQASFQSST